MSQVGEKERETQKRIVKLFEEKLGYKYLGNWKERKNNQNIEEEILRGYLKQEGYSQKLINRAVRDLIEKANNQNKNLYYSNKEVYSALRYGIKVQENAGENNQTVHFINWEEADKNEFAIAEEVTVKGVYDKRPDIVLYVNGIALGVIELKRSTISVSEGIRQNLDNQDSNFIKSFFSTIQLIMAGNNSEGLRYGVIETSEKYYLSWKEDKKYEDELTKQVEELANDVDDLLDKNIIGLCNQERLIEIIHDFIVYDRGIKKVCRHNQYFGVKAARKSIKKREGGIIWHTQGSGKSLTMVWLAKWIREHINNSRILIITDRDELDEQIKKVFVGVNEEIYRTKSGNDLLEKLNNKSPLIMCSLIHKFGRRIDASYDRYIEELKKSLPNDFKAKGDIYVFVDECHRTQSGKLHDAMEAILPNTIFIGFTGTPLLKNDKKNSVEVFGTYIHTYTFDEGVKDKVILDLLYEARDVDQNIKSQKKIDQWFEAKTKGLTDYAKVKLKQRWGTLREVLSSQSRLEEIVNDIIFDLETKDRLQNGRGNAILVANDIYEACKYYELFQKKRLKKCAIITSYQPSINDLKGESTGEDTVTESVEKYKIYKSMLKGKSVEEFEKEVKKKFIEEPAQMKLLIVVDKLLIGFDAPSATYLYIDKKMRDHGLFQAICRVNRLDGEDKEYGYIVDYKDLFKCLEKSIEDYTSEAFEDYDKKDVQGLLRNRLETGKERLDNALERIKALCEPVVPPKETINYIRYFCAENTEDRDALKKNEQKRLALYKYTVGLVRAYANIANEMKEAGYTEKETIEIQKYVEYYDNVRDEVMRASGDYIDLKSYEPAMRHLIDNYISAEESETISKFNDLTLIELIVERGIDIVDELPKGIKKDKKAVAETIENNVRRLIVNRTPTNPKYYENMSKLLDTIIKERKEEVTNYKEYLDKIVELTKQAHNPNKSRKYPENINSAAKMALYDNLGQNEEIAVAIDKGLKNTRPDGWRGHKLKERLVKNAIREHINDEEIIERIFEIVKKQGEY